MKNVLMVISLLGLVILISLPMMQFAGVVSKNAGQWGIQVGTGLWFLTAPFWMKSKK